MELIMQIHDITSENFTYSTIPAVGKTWKDRNYVIVFQCNYNCEIMNFEAFGDRGWK